MPTYTNTAKYLLRKLAGSNLVSDVDAGIAALADDVDSKFAGYSEGVLASRPTSTGGTPGIAGRIYRANDSSESVYYIDNGTGWDRLVRVRAIGSKTWDPPSIASGASTSTTVTVTGATQGDIALAGFPAGALQLSAAITGPATGTVTVTLSNLTGSPVDPGSATLNVVVLRAL
jgi:hypothetical protein